MKTSTIIRIILAVLLSTLACVGLLIPTYEFLTLCWFVAGMLLARPGTFTRPIVGREKWIALVVTALFVGLMLSRPLYMLMHPRRVYEHATPVAIPPALVALLWLFWQWGIYRYWQREKKATADKTALGPTVS